MKAALFLSANVIFLVLTAVNKVPLAMEFDTMEDTVPLDPPLNFDDQNRAPSTLKSMDDTSDSSQPPRHQNRAPLRRWDAFDYNRFAQEVINPTTGEQRSETGMEMLIRLYGNGSK